MMVAWNSDEKWFDSGFIAHSHEPLFEEIIEYVYQHVNSSL